MNGWWDALTPLGRLVIPAAIIAFAIGCMFALDGLVLLIRAVWLAVAGGVK